MLTMSGLTACNIQRAFAFFCTLLYLACVNTHAQLLPSPQPPKGLTQGAQQDPKAALLAQLDDYIEPDPTGIWPLAPGWWMLMILIITAAVVVFISLKKRINNQRYRKVSLSKLNQIHAMHTNTPQQQQAKLTALTVLTKQVYAHAYPNEKAPLTLTGKNWWLHILYSAPSSSISTEAVSSTPFEALYSPNMTLTAADDVRLYALALHFIKRHKTINKNTPFHYQKNSLKNNQKEVKHV